MPAFFLLEPEVPGGLGERTDLRVTSAGSEVLALHYEFAAGCQGDDLATSHPVFIISERVGARLGATGLTGFALADMEQTVDEQAYLMNPSLRLQPYRWLQVLGCAGVDDIGLDDGHELVVSERALVVLREHAQLSLCEIVPWRR